MPARGTSDNRLNSGKRFTGNESELNLKGAGKLHGIHTADDTRVRMLGPFQFRRSAFNRTSPAA
jgi:hypothetical protein